jgi:polyisoprenoid-binding protein YceI
MKTIHLLNITVLLLFVQVNYLAAQPFTTKINKATVSGTSSLHDWESTIEKIECSGTFTLANNTLADIKGIVVKIPVTSLKSTKGKTMDNKTYEAFNHEKNPTIIFTLNNKKVNAAASTLEAEGTLLMAGVTKAINVTLTYKVLPNGSLQIIGSKKLTMTDFKMEPPKAMMGTIKVGDEVTVYFDLTLNSNNTL